jgi:hypothetical protein
VQHLIQASFRLRIQRLHKTKAFAGGSLVVFIFSKAQRTLTHNDLEVMLLREPVAHIPSVNAHLECPIRARQEVPIVGTAFDKAWLFVTQLGFDALGHLEGVITHGLNIQCDLKREKVLKCIQAHTVGDQRGPLGFHIQQLRGDRLGEQRGQGAK